MADDKKQKTLFLDDASAASPPAKHAQPLSAQSTMMLDAAQVPPSAAAPVAAPGRVGATTLPPVARPFAWGRWLLGPLIAAVVATGTVFGAGVVMPRNRKPVVVVKPTGRLRVNSDPVGASILVDGRRHPRFTPTVVEGEIGATLKLTFMVDGYATKEEEVYVAEGEHPFNVKLVASTPAPAPAAPEAAAPVPAAPEAVPSSHHEHHSSSKPKEPAGTAMISIAVRPWAIVYIDKQRLRQTPINDYTLPAGKHVIELVNEGKNRRDKIEVTLKPGEQQDIKRDWDK
jgi:hypothetical protein